MATDARLCARASTVRLTKEAGEEQLESTKGIGSLRKLLAGLHLLVGHERIELGFVLAAGILIAPCVLGAEPGSRARVAILNSLGTTLALPATTSFVEELQRLGYAEGRNLTIDLRSAENMPARLPDLAREPVRLSPM
jgi:hypothetical protein